MCFDKSFLFDRKYHTPSYTPQAW